MQEYDLIGDVHGHALAVMGNHEFNALAYHTKHEGALLRPHTDKNTEQHQAFLNEDEPALKQSVLDFFYSLPVRLVVTLLAPIGLLIYERHLFYHKAKPDLPPSDSAPLP